MSGFPIEAVGALASPEALAGKAAPSAVSVGGASFSQMLLDGVDKVNQKLVDADAMVRAFALDDNVPLHQVTFALEEARLSMELMMQVRSRLVESYQRILEMQI